MFSLTPPHRSRIHPRMGAVLKILISVTLSVSVTLESWKSWKTQNTSKSDRTAEGGFSSFSRNPVFLKTTSKYLHKRSCLLVDFRGAKKSRKSHQIRAFLFDRNQWFSTCDTIFTEMGSRSTKKHLRSCSFFCMDSWKSGKWGAQNALFCCRFLGILGRPAGVSVPNGARARKPSISCRFS